MARITLERLRKSFGEGAAAVHDLDLEVEDGEFLTLLGPSGCGKTTTLRMIAGLETPSAGRILFDGKPVEKLAPARRNVAMVFQNYALYPHLTVAGNLDYPLRKRGVPRAERERRVRETAAMLQIEELLGRRPRQLSGGQQQRVALGRAMIREPSAFLLDEPLSNLDAQLRASMRAELIRLHREIGRTMVYVSHDQLEAMTMSDRIVIMHRGRLQQVGTPHEVYNRPANRFIAGFIGTPAMNLIDGELDGANGTLRFRAPGLSLPVDPLLAQGGGRRAVTVGIRPEHVSVAGGDVPAEVSVVEPVGHESLVILRLPGGAEVIARAPAESGLKPPQQIAIGLDARHLHLFDREDGRRIGAGGSS